jgi:hypothetical protein
MFNILIILLKKFIGESSIFSEKKSTVCWILMFQLHNQLQVYMLFPKSWLLLTYSSFNPVKQKPI